NVSENPCWPLLVMRNGARVTQPRDPIELKTALGECFSEGAGKMRAALAPIKTGAAKDTVRSARLVRRDAKAAEELFSRGGDDAAILAQHDMISRHQRVGQRHPEAPGKV